MVNMNALRARRVRFAALLTGLALACVNGALGDEKTGSYTSPPSLPGSKVINEKQLIDLINSRDELVVIDSRTANDRQLGHIEGSVWLVDTRTNCETLKEKLPGLKTPVVFYCNGIKCRRSDNAVGIARDCGYKEIYWYRGGIESWLGNRLPLVH